MTKKRSTLKVVEELKENSQDFEWYPTTTDILDIVREDIFFLMPKKNYDKPNEYPNPDILDIGAGNGSSLEYLTNGDRYAIEKSKILIDCFDKDTVIIGTEFNEVSLIDKDIDISFCNPPYQHFSQWMEKIIQQTKSKLVYIVAPSRWIKNKEIKEALKARQAQYKILDTTDFLNAERAARAKVDIIRIDFSGIGIYPDQEKPDRTYLHDKENTIDPFDLWFDSEFKFDNESIYTLDDMPEGKNFDEKIKNQLVQGRNLVDTLVNMYDIECKHLFDVYKGISKIDQRILAEIEISRGNIQKFLQTKMKGLKHKYWHELFSNFSKITDRLTTKTRNEFLSKLHGKVNVEFNLTNAYAVTSWVLKNANHYYDQQLISVYEDLISEANIIRYASNKRVFSEERQKYDYRHYEMHKAYGKVALNYRMIIEKGGLGDAYQCNGLSQSSFNLVNDLIVIAKNLGFSFEEDQGAQYTERWYSGKLQEFYATYKGEKILFMTCRAYLKGTTHLKMNPSFQKKLNVTHGLLKRWLKDYRDVEKEYNFTDSHSKVSSEEAADIISTGNFKIDVSSIKSLLSDSSPTLKIELPEAVLIETKSHVKPKSNTKKKAPIKRNNSFKKQNNNSQLSLLEMREKFTSRLTS